MATAEIKARTKILTRSNSKGGPSTSTTSTDSGATTQHAVATTVSTSGGGSAVKYYIIDSSAGVTSESSSAAAALQLLAGSAAAASSSSASSSATAAGSSTVVKSEATATPVVSNLENIPASARREILIRQPSYCKILDDLKGGSAETTVQVKTEESDGDSEAGSGSETVQTITINGQQYQIVNPAALSGAAVEGLQTLSAAAASSTTATTASTSTTVPVQYAATTQNGQTVFLPANTGATQVITLTSAGTSSPSPGTSATSTASTGGRALSANEEAARKREVRLMKNREAARECRNKKKEYIKCLEDRVAVLENQNKALIEELKSLKELYTGQKS